MTDRRRAILIVVLAVLLLGIIIFAVIYFWPKPKAASAPAVPATTEAPAAAAPAPVLQNPLKLFAATATSGSTAAAQVAELFAERYGSYSNQGGFQNLTDLLPVMTASYRAKTEAYLATASASGAVEYQGVTSVKVSTQIRSYSASAGTAVV